MCSNLPYFLQNSGLFVSHDDFIQPLIEQYPSTIKQLREAKKQRAQDVLSEYEALEEPDGSFRDYLSSDKDHRLLSEMLSDISRAYKTVRAYYQTGGKWDEAYCCLSRISGSPSFGCESIVERLVIGRLCLMDGQKQHETDIEFEARAERVQRGYDGDAAICAKTVVVRWKDSE